MSVNVNETAVWIGNTAGGVWLDRATFLRNAKGYARRNVGERVRLNLSVAPKDALDKPEVHKWIPLGEAMNIAYRQSCRRPTRNGTFRTVPLRFKYFAYRIVEEDYKNANYDNA